MTNTPDKAGKQIKDLIQGEAQKIPSKDFLAIINQVEVVFGGIKEKPDWGHDAPLEIAVFYCLMGKSFEANSFDLDNSEALAYEIDNLLDELSSADDRIKENQDSIDSLKIETKEMLATLPVIAN